MTDSSGHAATRTDPSGDADYRVESIRVLGRGDLAAFTVLTAASLAAIGYFLFMWFRHGDMGRHPLLFLFVTGLFALILVNQQGRWFLLLPMRRPRPATPLIGLRVAVVTTFVPQGEPVAMLEQSLAALVAIEYPHDTWLLDEGDEPKVRALCERLGVRHFSRRNRPEYQTPGRFAPRTKYGNYNAWLDAFGYDGYDVLAAFDPDHVPHPSFLGQTLGYLRDPAVGYVQAAQAFYNQAASFIARGAAEDTYDYFSTVQMASFGMGYPIIVGGHNVHRLTALRAVGGLAQHDADDLLLTLRYRAAGWRGVYVPKILARGLTPVDWRGYLTQQRRWARSVLDIKLRRWDEYSGRLPAATRVMSFLHGINFMHRSVIGLVATLILLWMVAIGGTHDFLQRNLLWSVGTLLLTLSLAEFYRQKFYLGWRNERGLHWRSTLLEWAKWPWFLFALMDVLLRRNIAYSLTWKSGRKGVWWKFLVVHGGLTLCVVAAGMFGALHHPAVHPFFRVWAAVVVVIGIALVVTELRGFPPPWEPRFWRSIPDPDRAP